MNNLDSMLSALKTLDPDLFPRLRRDITQERLYRYLQPLADTLAPSQTVSHTRAPLLEQLLRADGVLEHSHIHFERNYQNTGDSVLLLGEHPARKQIWLLAHLDIISYMIEPGNDGCYPLTPLCYHMMHPGRRAAAALTYNLLRRQFEIAAHGNIVTEADGGIFFESQDKVPLRAGQRVCFYSQMSWNRETGELRGSLDDMGAAVALVLAASFLADYDIELMLGLTDEEEGTAGSGNQTICRGGARLLRYFDQPELVIASDVQEAVSMLEGDGPIALAPGDGACFVEKGSRGRGAVTPPHLYELQRQLATELVAEGIHLRENIGGYVSRTEGVNAILRTPNVALIGFLGRNRHFEKEATTAHVQDLVDLARAVVCFVLLTRTRIWQEVMHHDD
jgi:hypothetical protein